MKELTLLIRSPPVWDRSSEVRVQLPDALCPSGSWMSGGKEAAAPGVLHTEAPTLNIVSSPRSDARESARAWERPLAQEPMGREALRGGRGGAAAHAPPARFCCSRGAGGSAGRKGQRRSAPLSSSGRCAGALAVFLSLFGSRLSALDLNLRPRGSPCDPRYGRTLFASACFARSTHKVRSHESLSSARTRCGRQGRVGRGTRAGPPGVGNAGGGGPFPRFESAVPWGGRASRTGVHTWGRGLVWVKT